MKKLFESPSIEITYFEEDIISDDVSKPTIGDFEDENVDSGGWV